MQDGGGRGGGAKRLQHSVQSTSPPVSKKKKNRLRVVGNDLVDIRVCQNFKNGNTCRVRSLQKFFQKWNLRRKLANVFFFLLD